jgi:hypothetical protein
MHPGTLSWNLPCHPFVTLSHRVGTENVPVAFRDPSTVPCRYRSHENHGALTEANCVLPRRGSARVSEWVPNIDSRNRCATLPDWYPWCHHSPLALPPTFLTVNEAARTVHKSPSSIRRIIYPIVRDDQHPDRHHIQPSVEEALRLRTKGENFPWRLSEELLRREVPIEAGSDASRSAADGMRSSPGDGYTELLAMLRRELDIKNTQITQQMELISGLSERLREGNILLGSLQHSQPRLPLMNVRDTESSERTKAKTSPAKPEKGSAAASKSAKAKRGFFSHLFSSR